MKNHSLSPPSKMDSSCSNAGAVYFIIVFIRFYLLTSAKVGKIKVKGEMLKLKAWR